MIIISLVIIIRLSRQSPHEVSTPIPQQVILYSGEPLSNHAEMAYLNTVQKVIPFYLNVSVLQISRTGYQTEGISL